MLEVSFGLVVAGCFGELSHGVLGLICQLQPVGAQLADLA